MQEILLPEGVAIGHADNDNTGVTVILADGGVCGVSVRGGAPGTRETDLLHNEAANGGVHAVVLSGGSAYGLSSCGGVMRYLAQKGEGVNFGGAVVPIVCGAVLFDLKDKLDFPDENMGFEAAENAKNKGVKFGSIGAGKGATVGKILGPMGAVKGGIGGSTVKVGDAFVTAVVAVNALGDVVGHETGKIIAGARLPNGEFLDTRRIILSGKFAPQTGGNTTIGCIITNVKLDKVQANKLAAIGHDGMAQSIKPTHTDFDGDALFALSKGDEVFDFSALSVMAVEAVACAIENAVK